MQGRVRATLWMCAIGAAIAAVGSPTTASAAIIGTNPVLDGNGGSLYIPLTGEMSGVLGDPLPEGGQVGLQEDRVKLSGDGATSTGTVSFVITFALDEPMSSEGAGINLAARDIDFLTVGGTRALFWETLSLTCLENTDDAPGSPDLAIDDANYGLYRPDGFGETNNTLVDYTFDLRDDLGMTPDAFAAINADLEFGLLVTLAATIEQVKDVTDTYFNSPENLANSFSFTPGAGGGNEPPVPEPGVLTLLTLGGAALLLRRRLIRRRE